MELFIQETNRRLERIEDKLDDLSEFKMTMIASSRTVSFVVSAVSGMITLIISVLTVIKVKG